MCVTACLCVCVCACEKCDEISKNGWNVEKKVKQDTPNKSEIILPIGTLALESTSMYDAIPNVMFKICYNKLSVHVSIKSTNYTDIQHLTSVEHCSHQGKYNVTVIFSQADEGGVGWGGKYDLRMDQVWRIVKRKT